MGLGARLAQIATLLIHLGVCPKPGLVCHAMLAFRPKPPPGTMLGLLTITHKDMLAKGQIKNSTLKP